MSEWDGEGYAQVSGLQRTLAERSLSGLELTGAERLLDVGCGDGFITLALAGRLPRGSVVGVDASAKMVDKARSRPVPDGATATFLVADARELPFEDEFDVVVSFNALHWVREQRRALAGIARAAHPSARVIIQMVCASERPSLESVAMRVCGEQAWAASFAGFEAPYIHVDPAAYPELAASAGLVVTDLRTSDLDWDFGSRDEFSRWCAVGFAAWTARLDADRVPRFVDDVVRAYEEVSGGAGLFRFTQMRVAFAVATATR
ncbi:class I SAM-dependent methyltransferase [Rhodococcus maanshanensis]|uniref:Trans-aconitate 2-methyltransferase n=1 Tax=Rhodococcus maanshanensis TaxID=183556 RepID=A0A1H7KDT7_9NOCA|nr:class I SAM-dependent methyltransferase [Rhodococcus maanshanensis]SEK84656.1 trans-aconitate 2-methyltransferase [Rhodococcus maanshanensis]